MMQTVKKWILIATASLLLIVGLDGCTQNNGDIGPWFGTWKLDSMTINGAPDTEYAGNVLWKFQANLLSMIRVFGSHEQYEMYGTWSEPQPGVLRIEFIYSDDAEPEGSMKYSPLPETHLPPGISDLDILEMKGSRLYLRYLSAGGTVYEYRLTKW